MTVSGSGFCVGDGCATPGPSCSFSLSATRVAAGAAISANAVCVAMPATMTHESSHEPQASTFALYCPGFACRGALPPLPARQRPMKSPPMSMFPKASLTGRVVLANNTMRMAKSWGHRGGCRPRAKALTGSTVRCVVLAKCSVDCRSPNLWHCRTLNCFPGGFSAKLFAQCGKAYCYRVAASWRCRNATHGENSNGVA